MMGLVYFDCLVLNLRGLTQYEIRLSRLIGCGIPLFFFSFLLCVYCKMRELGFIGVDSGEVTFSVVIISANPRGRVLDI